MFIGSDTVCLIVKPLPLVDIAVSMYQGSMAVGLVSLPLSIILGTILPDLLTIAILHSIEQLSCVYCPIAQREWPVCLPLIAVYHVLCDA